MLTRIHPALIVWINGLACGLVVVVNLFLMVRLAGEPFGPSYRFLALLAGLSMSFSATRMPLLRPWLPGRPRSIGSRMLRIWAGTVGGLLMLGFLTGSSYLFSQVAILSWTLTTPLLLLALNEFVLWLAARLPARRRRTAVFVAMNDAARSLALAMSAGRIYEPLGFFAPSRREGPAALPHLGPATAAARYVRDHHIDAVFVALSDQAREDAMDVVEDLSGARVSIYFLLDSLSVDVLRAQTRDVAGLPVLAIRGTPFYGADGLLKRGADVLFSAIALILAAPLMMVLAALVGLSFRGGFLSRERRYDFQGRRFQLLRFRTATMSEEGAKRSFTHLLSLFLQRSAFEELPQLLNVLRGDLSLVGPPSHPVAHHEHHRRAMLRHMVQRRLRPGLTGLAQIRGVGRDAAQIARLEERIAHDLDYIRHWSPLLDLKILFSAFARVLRGRESR